MYLDPRGITSLKHARLSNRTKIHMHDNNATITWADKLTKLPREEHLSWQFLIVQHVFSTCKVYSKPGKKKRLKLHKCYISTCTQHAYK
jgi:hypothetical protein